LLNIICFLAAHSASYESELLKNASRIPSMYISHITCCCWPYYNVDGTAVTPAAAQQLQRNTERTITCNTRAPLRFVPSPAAVLKVIHSLEVDTATAHITYRSSNPPPRFPPLPHQLLPFILLLLLLFRLLLLFPMPVVPDLVLFSSGQGILKSKFNTKPACGVIGTGLNISTYYSTSSSSLLLLLLSPSSSSSTAIPGGLLF